MIDGTTFSVLQCEYLGITDARKAFEGILKSNNYTLVRLGSYWSRIEITQGIFDFDELDELLTVCREQRVQVMLTVGMKAPRWPEFHLPQWAIRLPQEELYNYALRFVEQVMLHAQQFADVIAYVQMENEPFHKFDVNANRSIPYSFVKNEIAIVRKYLITGQKIALTCGLSMTIPCHWQDLRALFYCIRLVDMVGFNVYVKMGIEQENYLHAHWLYWKQLELYRFIINLFKREAFIAEMQDEPWEHGSMVHVGRKSYPSWSEEQTDWLREKLKRCRFEMILEWGCEWQSIVGGAER